MGSRVRRPDVETLTISQGDTLTVKKYLTAGEFRELLRTSTRPVKYTDAQAAAAKGADLAIEIDPTESGLAIVLAYLLDWTFTDADGRPLVIRDQPSAVVRAALDAIDAESYMEVQRAIQTHDRIMKATIAQEKKPQNSATDSAPILQSVG